MNKQGSMPKHNNNREQDARLERQLEHFYRFSGLVGSTLRVDMLLQDTLDPLLKIAVAERILVSLVPLGESDGPVVKHRNWEAATKKTLTPDDVTLLGTDIVALEPGDALPVSLKRVLGVVNLPLAIVPLWAYGRALGVAVFAGAETPFDTITLKLLLTAGRQLALAVENARLFADLEMSYHHLLYTQDEMIRSERMAAVGALAATMAHEIRNPLATIFSSLSQIRKHAQIAGDSATLLQIAEEEAIRMNRLVSGLLEFARPGVPRFEEVALAGVVRDVVQGIRDTLDSGNRMEISVGAEREDLSAEVDINLFKKAVQHVVNNAVAAVDAKKGTIQILITSEESNTPEKKIVVVTVTDNGQGVAREIQNKVFEPFYSTKPSGLGLGLPTVARIVNDHGGMVTFDSEPKEGTTVKMAFRTNQPANGQHQPPDDLGL